MHMHLSFWMRACAMTSVIRVTVYVTRARRGARAPPAPLYKSTPPGPACRGHTIVWMRNALVVYLTSGSNNAHP